MPSRHARWGLVDAGNIDKQIEARLLAGQEPEAIAEGLGVATGYVEEFVRELAPPAPPRPERQVLEHEPLEARPRVFCLVSKLEIGARECVDRQTAQRCFCPRGSFAINSMAELAAPGSRLLEQLVQCRGRAREAQKGGGYLGPGRDAHEGRPIAPVPLFAGELPAPPNGNPGPRITVTVRTTEKEREAIVAAVSRAVVPPTTTAPPVTPAPPAKEKTMPRTSKLDEMTDDQVSDGLKKYGSFAAAREAFGVGTATLRERLKKIAAKEPAAPTQKPPRNLLPVLAVMAAEPTIEERMRSRLDHLKLKISELRGCETEANKLERALEAMAD